jgi:hypothetical protein
VGPPDGSTFFCFLLSYFTSPFVRESYEPAPCLIITVKEKKTKNKKSTKQGSSVFFHSVPSPLLSMSLQPFSSSHLSSVFLILQFSSSLSGLIPSFSFKLGKKEKKIKNKKKSH